MQEPSALPAASVPGRKLSQPGKIRLGLTLGAFLALFWCLPAQAADPSCKLQVTPDHGPAPLAVTAKGSCSEGKQKLTVVLDWGDGTRSGEPQTFTDTHTYNVAGSFLVTVTATDKEGNSGTANHRVNVSSSPPPPPPPPPPSSNPLQCAPIATPSVGEAPLTVNIAANCSDSSASITSIVVDFGDGYFQTGDTTSHTYLAGGAFAVSVHASDSAGNSAVASAQVGVKGPSSIFVGVNNGQVKQFGKDGTAIRTLNSNQGGSTTGMGFDLFGNLYVTDFTADSVSKFDAHGNLIGAFGSGYNCKPESVVFDVAGNAYVGETGCSHALLKFDSDGNLIATYQVATEVEGSDWIDLASDQCTMYYTSQGKSVLRYNVCNQQQLTPLTTHLETGLAIRVLPDGGALVANLHNLVRVDVNGNVVTTYDAAGEDCWSGLTLDGDRSSFWATDYCTSDVFRFDIASSAQISKFNSGTPTNTVYGVATLAATQFPTAGTFFASPNSASISQGQAASYNVSFDPNDGAKGKTFTFSCANLPVGANCAFSPGSATSQGHVSVMLTINTTSASASLLPSIRSMPAIYTLVLPLFGLALMSPIGRRLNEASLVLFIAVLIVAVCLFGCAGASNGSNPGTTASSPTVPSPPVPSSGATPSGTYTVIVHATSEGLQSSTTVQLSVR